jgi:Flp pilus assembly protein TadD
VAYHLQYWDSSEGDQFLLAYPGALELENIQLLRGKPDWNMLQQAITEYRQVLDVEPGNKYAANNLGVALAELRQVTEAEATLREALRVDTQDFILFTSAWCLYQSYQKIHGRP